MNITMHEDNIKFEEKGNHKGGTLIGSAQRTQNGFSMGISYYSSTEYGNPGIHEDLEGFYVLQGTGMAKLGEEEFEISPGVAFIAHARVPHSLKTNVEGKPVKILWCHGAI